MSRHFNYELDERRIKILLKENSMPYSDDVWNEFLSQTKPINKTTKLPTFKPVSFAINKSVLLTGVFILLIGSFTFLIANYVDFGSAQSNKTIEREVKPDPDNFKLTKVAKALPVKKTETSPAVVPTTQTLAAITPSVPVTTNTVQQIAVTTKTYAPIINEEPNVVPRMKQDSGSIGSKDSTGITQNQNDKLRKKKKKQAETLESKPLTTELPTAEEPELELK